MPLELDLDLGMTVRCRCLVRKILNVNPLENVLEVVLIPPRCRSNTRQFPHAIKFLVEVLIRSLSVAPPIHPLEREIRKAVMCCPELMMSDHLSLGNPLPPCLPEKVLGLDQRIAKESWITDHAEEVVGRHVFPIPSIIHHPPIVDLPLPSAAGGTQGTPSSTEPIM